MEPFALLRLHIPGNPRTAGYADPIAGTRAEVAYMNRKGGDGPSAHTYVARDGTVFACIDPVLHAAWSNGDLTNPDTRWPLIRRLAKLREKGRSANEAFFREVEMTGFPGKFPPTKAQMESVAWLLARDAMRTGLPIRAGETVAIHGWINTINRASCPFGQDPVRRVNALCQAGAHPPRAQMMDAPDAPEPPDEPPPDQSVEDALRDELEAARGQAEKLEAERADLLRVVSTVGDAVAPWLPEADDLDEDDEDDE